MEHNVDSQLINSQLENYHCDLEGRVCVSPSLQLDFGVRKLAELHSKLKLLRKKSSVLFDQ